MENFYIFLTIFFTLVIVDNNYKSEASHLSKPYLIHDIHRKEVLFNKNNHLVDIKCHHLNNLIPTNGLVEKKFKLTVHGNIVNFKRIPFKNHCNGSIVIVEIFATEKIIIDRNFNARGKSIVFIVAAPLWHVIGRRIINLNGYNGRRQKLLNAHNGDVRKNINGRSGKEGFPGGPGGQFQGIAGFIINKENLVVRYNGGRGGNGQNGGHGARGQSGTEFNLNVSRIQANGFVPGFKVTVKNVERIYNYKNDNETAISYYIDEDVIGRRARIGGNGGNGAPGGIGGYPGYYSLFDLNNSTCTDRDVIRFVENRLGIRGANGIDGLGGHSGPNGTPGKDVSLYLLVNDAKKIEILKYTVFEHDNYKKGRHGIDGKYIIGKLQPVRQMSYQVFDTTESLFKTYLKSHINDTNVSADSWYHIMQTAILRCSFYQNSRTNIGIL
ncbi:uncharacterized protein LOC122512543 [Leptopilina heterotoma]|uniref:uncharacterized protein LOC122512543 n=1 Tax=Leptopilina heterotoma TaxID=63436 RepID=UPI001CA92A1F|nr:uncharacterized protein LOC122512543 [Leptopilina heterotoma]